MRRHSQEVNNVVVNRIDFKEGGSLDGGLLSQILARIRNLEYKNSGIGRIEEFVNSTDTPLISAVSNILIFNQSTTAVKKYFNSDIPSETFFKFGNTSNVNVNIYPDDEIGSPIIASIVPGEFVKIILHDGTWIKTFGP